jgi:predicted  nucleic acid-binding Zn-ribbon protein
MEEIICISCGHAFEVEEYSFGECPKCHKAEYSWEEYWDEKDPDAGYGGFEWGFKIDYSA